MSKRVREGFIEGPNGEELVSSDVTYMIDRLAAAMKLPRWAFDPTHPRKIKDVDIEIVEPKQLPEPKGK